MKTNITKLYGGVGICQSCATSFSARMNKKSDAHFKLVKKSCKKEQSVSEPAKYNAWKSIIKPITVDIVSKLKWGEGGLTYLGITEYLSMEKSLSKSGLKIRKMWKVYNERLYSDYNWKKQYFSRALTNKNLNERELYHGTSIETVPKIVSDGFLRQFNRRCTYGKGCYFSVSAHYASNSRYATVSDSSSVQFMFICSVICGESCKGREYMKVPNLKPNQKIRYETTVDSMSYPSMYVTYTDNQAIPLYLVAFTK